MQKQHNLLAVFFSFALRRRNVRNIRAVREEKQHNLLADFRKGTILMKPTRHVFSRNSKIVFCSKNFSYQYDLDRPQAATSAKRSHFGDF